MKVLRLLGQRFFRIDARSLGLFRILFGCVLLIDLKERWAWLPAFYSNDGVLPNHVHLFQLRESGRVFSAFHAFSLRDETFVAFCVTFAFYGFFTLGWHTRLFSVASAVALVSLAGRNILTNSIGDSAAIALLLIGVFLPLGARFSLDSLRHSFASCDEHSPAALNDRTRPATVETGPGLAGLVLVLVVGLIPLAAALQQKGGAWARGDALYYALRSDRWLSAMGEFVRNKASLRTLTVWTKLLRGCEFAILPLALIPVGRRFVRPAAMLALGMVGATFALCFNYGPYGWSLLAAVALLVPEETWNARRTGTYPIRVIYDEDCGMCLWLARLLKRLDVRGNVSFLGNGTVERGETADLPESITSAMVQRSIVVIDPKGRVHTDALAMSHVFRALPFGSWLGHAVALPGLRHAVAALYHRVAARRLDISVACGLGACGLPDKSSENDERGSTNSSVFPPATRLQKGARGVLTTVLVGFVFATFLAATDANNNLPVRSGLGTRGTLLGAASYLRISAPWGLWAPEPAMHNETLVTVATMRDDRELDVLNGAPPDPELAIPGRHRLGPLWAAYVENVHASDNPTFRQELRRYLTRGGRVSDEQNQPTGVNKLQAFWVSAPIPAPGERASGLVERVELLDTGNLPRPSHAGNVEFGRGPLLRREPRSEK